MRVAIVGAGVAGLSCAGALEASRVAVDLFDSARVPGGRVTTKKVGLVRCDAGAPYFMATSAAFRAEVAGWSQLGFAARYSPRWSPDSVPPQGELWTGTPGMSAIPRELGSALRFHWETVVSRVDGGRVISRAGLVLGEFDQVVLALPMTALREVLGAAAPFGDAVVRRLWSVSLAWKEHARADWHAAAWQGRLLAGAVKESSKPDRAAGEHWMAYLTPEASAELSNPADVVDAAREELAAMIEARGDAEARAHRWEEDVGLTPLALRVGEQLVVCGVGSSVESAWLRGRAAAALL